MFADVLRVFSRPCCETLAYIDLDHFKRANDTQGHAFGDLLLQSFAKILSGTLRTSDVYGRIGGDEFVVFLPECSAKNAQILLEKIRVSVVEDARFQLCSVTVSIGAVSYVQAPNELSEMVRAADNVMYQVKASTKNTVHVQDFSEFV